MTSFPPRPKSRLVSNPTPPPQDSSDIPTLILLAILLSIPAGALQSAAWTEHLITLAAISILSLLCGYALAKSRFGELTVSLLALIYGAFAVWVYGASFLNPEIGWRERLVEILTRVSVWVQQAAGGGFSRDNLIFLMGLAIVFWYLGINAAMTIFRVRQLWVATVPPGLGLLINNYYYFGKEHLEYYLIAYVFLTLSLSVLTNISLREQLWRRNRAGFSPGATFDVLRGGIAGVFVLVVIAWSAPAASASERLASAWDRSINPWNQLQDEFVRLFGGLEGGVSATADYYGGATLSLGGPVLLGDNPVLYVYAPQGYRYYWRSKLFDVYDGRRWLTSGDTRLNSDFGALPLEENQLYLYRRNVQLHIDVAIPATRLVYAAGQPVSYSSLPISYDVIYTNPPGTQFATVTSARGKNLLQSGRGYSAVSSMSVADQTSLRGAGTEYPEWVQRNYLQLPENISARVMQLTHSIADPYANPYDQARAIEGWLRENITYNQQVDPPPVGVEPIDHFLFETRQGYCNYYASSMVIMLRIMGVPSRVAVGFAQGSRDPATGAFLVRESDAHSWVEAYFPHYGWIEFEPTAVMAPIVRADAPPVAGNELFPEDVPFPIDENSDLGQADQRAAREKLLEGNDFGAQVAAVGATISPVVWWGLGLAIIAALAGGGAWLWFETNGLSSLTEISRSYARVNIFAALLGIPVRTGDTPLERGQQIGAEIPEAERSVSYIADYYVMEKFAPRTQSDLAAYKDQSQAHEIWRLLRPVFVREAGRRAVRWVIVRAAGLVRRRK